MRLERARKGQCEDDVKPEKKEGYPVMLEHRWEANGVREFFACDDEAVEAEVGYPHRQMRATLGSQQLQEAPKPKTERHEHALRTLFVSLFYAQLVQHHRLRCRGLCCRAGATDAGFVQKRHVITP